ncbi:MAG TPA: glycosyltransferase family 39 protein [Phycisphaerae bacterium]|nr:glycosyltransferase family 39 protein [Phycisphaerae bacterium]
MIAAGNNPNPPNRRWLLLACLIAAVPHAVFCVWYPHTPLSPDEQEYLSLGAGLAENGRLQLSTGDVALRMPLYPLLIAGVHEWQKSNLWQNAVQLLQTFIAWCSTIIIALTAERLAGGRAGLLAAIIAALYSPFLYLQMSFLTETLLIFFLSLAILIYLVAGIHARLPAIRNATLLAVAGLIGLAALTRADALLLIVPFAVDAAIRRGPATLRIARVAMLLLPVLLVAVGWGLRNQREIDRFTLSTYGGLNFYLGHNSGYAANPGLDHADYQIFRRMRTDGGLTESQADQLLFRQGLTFIADHPGQTVIDTISKLFVWLRTTVSLSAPTILPLGFGVLAMSGWLRDRRSPLTGRKRSLYLASFAAFWPALLYWLLLLWETNQVWTSPLYVVPIGLFALFLLRSTPAVRGLLFGLFGTQLLVALVFIPIERLRWTVDGILIVAISVGLSRLCQWLSSPDTAERAGQTPP